MSTACEETGGGERGDASQVRSRSQSDDKAVYEEEELDYEEEMEFQSKSNNILKNEEEEGELSDDSIDEQTQANPVSKDKDEGEIDDEDDLEEGEVKEEEEDEGAIADVEDSAKIEPEPRRNRNYDLQPDLRSSRPDNQRYNKSYYNNNYHNSRPQYNSRTNDRYTASSRVRDYNSYTAPPAPLAPAASQTESAWERGLKQARELLSKASKRKEEEVDFENKRFNMTTGENNPPLLEVNTQFSNNRMRSSREKSPSQKRRRHSPHSSSEDEVERRHRLAYDAAPWNNPSSSNYQSSSYRSNRPNYPSSNRSAETYRDPWRRSKSPKLSLSAMPSRNKRPESDTRYDEPVMRSRHQPHSSEARDHRYGGNNNGGGGPQRSKSISSLSSIDSQNSSKSPRRKLPYSRPNVEAGNRYDREHDMPGRNDNFPKSRMDRIPKKSNASVHQTSDRVSEAKSFDSWSESLSDSESSSYYSDSSDESDVESSSRDPKLSKVHDTDKRSQGKLAKSEGVDAASGSRGAKDALAREAHLKTKSVNAINKRQGREAKKPPIKMTFMKTQTSLKKDRLIDEQLNGDEEVKSPAESLPDDMITEREMNHSLSPKFSSKSASHSKSQSEDEEEDMKPHLGAFPLQARESSNDHHSSGSSSPNSNSEKINRRELLLKKLKQVEAAIERKLNKK